VERVRKFLDDGCGSGRLGSRIEKVNLHTSESRAAANRDAWETGRDEKIHDSIVGAITLHVEGVPVPVQLVGFDTSAHFLGRTDIVTHLDRITDLPACVSYSVHEGERVFHVPDRAREPLETKRVSKRAICAARQGKYEARGYTFF
jgi:hypothetical protein